MLPTLRKLFEEAKASAVVRNLGWLVLERALRFVTNLLLGFWVARYLGLTDFGRLSYALVGVLMLSTFSELGLEQVLRRRFLQQAWGREEQMTAAFLLRLAAGALCAVALAVQLLLGGQAGEERVLFLILLPLVFQPALFTPDAWLQAKLRARESVKVQMVSLLAGAALRVMLILVRAPLPWFAAVSVLEMLLAGLGFHLRTRGWHSPLRLRVPSLPVIRGLLAEAFPLLLASLASILYMRIDVMMLRWLRGVEQVGIYAAGTRFSEVWFFLPSILATSLLPGLLAARERDAASYRAGLQRYYDLNVLCAFGIALFTSLAAPWLVPVAYGGAFAGAVSVTVLHVWTLVFIFLGVARGQFLINEGLGQFYLVSNAGGALLNVLCNLVLIPRLGAPGAACGTLVACSFSGWLSGWLNPKTRDTACMQTLALLAPFRLPSLLRTRFQGKAS